MENWLVGGLCCSLTLLLGNVHAQGLEDVGGGASQTLLGGIGFQQVPHKVKVHIHWLQSTLLWDTVR